MDNYEISRKIYLSFLSSHRVANNQPLISLGATQAIIRAEIERDDRTLQIDLERNISTNYLSTRGIILGMDTV